MPCKSQPQGHWYPQFRTRNFGFTWVEPLEAAVHMICTAFFTLIAQNFSSPEETEREKSKCPSQEECVAAYCAGSHMIKALTFT
jgi:hypothetical protein